MRYKNFIIKEKIKEVAQTTIFRVLPLHREDLFLFDAGQHCKIINSKYSRKDGRYFSVASSPLNKNYIEFAIKKYGNWTQAISNLQIGDSLKIAGPIGQFTWDKSLKNVVFVVGGLGIAPLMSMLRYAEDTGSSARIVLIYCNRTPEVVVFKDELERLRNKLPHFKVVHVFSNSSQSYSGGTYKGFIGEEVIKKETALSKKPTFFVIGPPIFMKSIDKILNKLQVHSSQIRKELLPQKAYFYMRIPFPFKARIKPLGSIFNYNFSQHIFTKLPLLKNYRMQSR